MEGKKLKKTAESNSLLNSSSATLLAWQPLFFPWNQNLLVATAAHLLKSRYPK